jgi:V/A-type H+-transporting ATPase subunit I
MQKIILLLSSKDVNKALGSLRSLGLVHIKHMREPVADAISNCEHKLQLLDRVLRLLGDTKTLREDLDKDQLSFYVKEIIILDRRRQELEARLSKFKEEQEWYQNWGDVSSASLIELRKSGIFVKLYLAAKRDLKKIPPEIPVYSLKKNRGQVYLAAFFNSQEGALDLEEVEFPPDSPRSLQKKIAAFAKELEGIKAELVKAAGYKRHFGECRKEILKRLEFYRVRFGMSHQEQIYCLQGFCPQEAVSEITRVAEEKGWAIVSQEPAEDEEVPTLIRNPRWVDIIRPVFKFMGTIPGYREYDISFWFLVFFSIFFAMLVGDAGYGLLFLAITFLVGRKFKGARPDIFFLLYLLSGATVLWGAVTGTWFGLEGVARLPFFNSLIIEKINSFAGSNQVFMIHLCFFIGAIHLSIAHGIRAFRFINSRLALAQLGWIAIIWSVFFIAGKLVLNKAVPPITSILFIAGAVLVILCSYPKRNIFKGALLSLAGMPLSIINSFSDVVSYLRLFAVGYATVAVASAFNNMALSSGVSGIFSGITAALILFLGHTLNILLALMAVIVHGIRLNMLEFSSHLNMEWSGIKYEPFRE